MQLAPLEPGGVVAREVTNAFGEKLDAVPLPECSDEPGDQRIFRDAMLPLQIGEIVRRESRGIKSGRIDTSWDRRESGYREFLSASAHPPNSSETVTIKSAASSATASAFSAAPCRRSRVPSSRTHQASDPLNSTTTGRFKRRPR